MNINCQPPLQFVYFSTDTHIPWISHNTLRDRLFKNGVAIRKKVYLLMYHLITLDSSQINKRLLEILRSSLQVELVSTCVSATFDIEAELGNIMQLLSFTRFKSFLIK